MFSACDNDLWDNLDLTSKCLLVKTLHATSSPQFFCLIFSSKPMIQLVQADHDTRGSHIKITQLVLSINQRSLIMSHIETNWPNCIILYYVDTCTQLVCNVSSINTKSAEVPRWVYYMQKNYTQVVGLD